MRLFVWFLGKERTNGDATEVTGVMVRQMRETLEGPTDGGTGRRAGMDSTIISQRLHLMAHAFFERLEIN